MAEATKDCNVFGLGPDIKVTSKMVHEELTNLSVDRNTENRKGFSPLIWWLIGRLTEKGNWTPLKAFVDSIKFRQQLHQCVKFKVGATATGRCTVPALGSVLIVERCLQIWRWPHITVHEYEAIDGCHQEDGFTCLNMFHYRKKGNGTVAVAEEVPPPPLDNAVNRDVQPAPTLPMDPASVLQNVANVVDDNIDLDAAFEELAEDGMLLDYWQTFQTDSLHRQN